MKSLSKLIRECQLESALKEFNQNVREIDDFVKYDLIITMSRICYDNLSKPEKIDDESLVLLFKSINGRFAARTSSFKFESYLRSVYIVGNFLLEKQNYDGFMEIKEAFFPAFTPPQPTKHDTEMYSTLIGKMYNTIIKLPTAKDNKKNAVNFMDLLIRSMSMVESTLFTHELPVNLSQIILNNGASGLFFESFTKFLCNLESSSAPHLKSSLLLYSAIALHSQVISSNISKASLIIDKMSEQLDRITPEMKDFTKILITSNWMMSHWNPSQAKQLLTSLKRSNKLSEHTHYLYFIWHSSHTAYLYYKQADSKRWVNLVPEVHIKCYKFLLFLSDVFKEVPYKCKCTSCNVTTHLKGAFKLLHFVVDLTLTYLIESCETNALYTETVLNVIEKWITIVKELKENNCMEWKSNWKIVALMLYNLGKRCKEINDMNSAIACIKAMLNYSFDLEGSKPTIVAEVRIYYSFQLMASIYLASKKYTECLAISALGMSLTGDIDSKLAYYWSVAKYQAKNDGNEDLIASTCVKVIETNANFIRTINNLKLNKEQKITLLKAELWAYQRFYKSKGAMMNAFKELADLEDAEKMGEVLTSILGDGSTAVDASLPTLMSKIISRLERKNVQSVTLAHLYYLLHRYKVKKRGVETCIEIEKTLSVTQLEATTEPNSVCDIVTSYESLTLANYLHMMRYLKKSLDMLVTANENVHDLLKNIASEYHLHGWYSEALQAYKMALEMSTSDVQKLEIISFICGIEANTELMKQGDDIASRFLEENIHNDELVYFYVSKSNSLFYTDCELSYEAYKTASKLIEQIEKPSVVNKMRFACLNFQFMMLSREELEGKTILKLGSMIKAHHDMLEYYGRTSHLSGLEARVFIEVNVAIIKFFHVMADSFNVRYYGKEVVIIAQKMLLPFRSIELLFYLGIADFQSNRFDDLRVKLNGIWDIIDASCLSNLCKDQTSKLDEEIDKLERKLGKVKLNDERKESAGSSPSELRQNQDESKIAQICYHAKNCECLPCTNASYHEAVLISIYFNGLLSLNDDRVKDAQKFFMNGLSFYELYKKPALKYSHCLILYEYCNLLLRSGKLKHAANVNKILMAQLESNRLQYGQFRNQAVVQSCVIDLLEEPESKVENLNEAFCELAEDYKTKKVQIKVTPESKLHPATIKIFESDEKPPTPKPKRRMKPLKFNLSDEENEQPNKRNTRSESSRLEPPTPNPEVERHLRSRSKLLTNKLKKSKPASQSNDENVRKNLRLELEKEEKVTKTTRSKRQER